MYGPKWPFLLRYGSRDMRRIDFPRVDGLSTDPWVLGRHNFTATKPIEQRQNTCQPFQLVLPPSIGNQKIEHPNAHFEAI